MAERFIVTAGRVWVLVDSYIHHEDGERREVWDWRNIVSFSTEYGIEYTHLTWFSDDPAGERQACRLRRRVEAALNTKGLTAINEAGWATRTIYGSQAYIDQEPEIVERERSDALLG